jgi:hypothetical protein
VIPQPFQRHTQYGEYVYEHVGYLTSYSNVYYTAEQLAAHCNLKCTHSFRRHIGRMVVERQIAKFVVQRPEGGFIGVYAKFGSNPPTQTEYWTPTPAPKYQKD